MRNPLLEVTPVIPPSLVRLPELASNLFFGWHRPTRALFEDLDTELWRQTGGNPRLMLSCLPQATLDRISKDSVYLARYKQALETLDAYLSESAPSPDQPLTAYFCAEYGFHESSPSTPAASACWPVTTAKPPATTGRTSSRSACYMGKGISPSPSTTTASNTRNTASACHAISPLSRPVGQMGNGRK